MQLPRGSNGLMSSPERKLMRKGVMTSAGGTTCSCSYIVQCIWHIAHCTLYIVHCILYIVYCSLHTAHCTFHIAHYILHTAAQTATHLTSYLLHCTLQHTTCANTVSCCTIGPSAFARVHLMLVVCKEPTPRWFSD